MLSRAAFRALRATPSSTFPRIAPIASASQRSRFYANTPGKDNTWKPSDPIKFDESNKSRPNPVNPSEQPEFDAEAAPERNTAPETEPAEKPDATPAEPQKPLPDLRQGIPSTFAAEFAKAQAEADKGTHDPNNITDDPAKEPSSASAGREGGELPKSAYETSTDRRRNRVANWSYLLSALFGVTGAVYMGRNWDTEEEEKAHPDVPQGWTPSLMYKRAYARLNNQMGYYTEPTFPKLLPDMDPAPPLTLVLSLEDLLVHSEWTTKSGWRTAKRPGVDYFLRYLSQYYELVIFTSVKSMDADPIIRKLDPFQMVMWPLFREATRYEKGEYVKDLSCLNRDLSKTIIIDTDPSHVKLQPENAIILPKWKGQPGDTGLVGLIPFLEYLAMLAQGSNLDVRQALKSMEGKDISTEFARREAKMRAQFLADIEKDKAKRGKPRVGGFLTNQLGMGKQGNMILSDGTNVSEGMAQGKMMIDMFREIGRKNYEELDKEIRTNGQKYLKEREEEEKRMQEEQMKSMKSSAFGWFAGAPPAHTPSTTAPSAPQTPEQK
ncbi:HAD-like protein [Byssothecium circinans]|uniref:Mitochondrial import inner membrane translocase subunit TIM50 n=1 Tax=Byssothecium circinans TaxID=147558 RepID=A0A6A5TPV7_9PLEO|nr:HAD-like protein [Byssothecium circinans]